MYGVIYLQIFVKAVSPCNEITNKFIQELYFVYPFLQKS